MVTVDLYFGIAPKVHPDRECSRSYLTYLATSGYRQKKRSPRPLLEGCRRWQSILYPEHGLSKKTKALMRNRFSLLLFAVTLAHGSLLQAQTNSAFRYRSRSPVQVRHSKVYTKDSISLQLKVTVKGPLEGYKFVYNLSALPAEGTSEKAVAPGRYSHRIFRWQIARQKTRSTPALLFEVEDLSRQIKYPYILPLGHPERINYPDFRVYTADNEAVLEQYVPADVPLLFRSVAKQNTTAPFYVYHYANSFAAARPPMVEGVGKVAKDLAIDSLFTIAEGDTFSLSKTGLYFAQSDSSSINGLGFRVEDAPYPKFNRLKQLIPPLIYITTKEEWALLKAIKDDKEAFDRFWLKMTSSPLKAKDIIKKYYRRVKEANTYFSDYKEGWKTDMGMIYIVYGPPDIVTQKERMEVWSYKRPQNLPLLKFSFKKIDNIFVANHYALIRNTNYKSSWLAKVEEWRNGR